MNAIPSLLPAVLAILLVQGCQEPSTPGQDVDPSVQNPVLDFPEPGLDDPAAYEGYATRFYRDSRGNAFQVYMDGRSGRVVHVWADAANASAGFNVRDPEGQPAPLVWASAGAEARTDGPRRVMRHHLASPEDAIELGWFLLGTMRQERDFQYLSWHRRPYGDPPFVLPELTGLIESLERVSPEERARHLDLLGASDVEELRSRLVPHISLGEDNEGWNLLVEHETLDGRNHMTLRVRGDRATSVAALEGDVLSVRALSEGGIELEVTVTTDHEALTPFARDRLFNEDFEAFQARQQGTADSLRRALPAAQHDGNAQLSAIRRFERQVRALELLSSEQKMMASLPNYATYFGRDMMMTALMLEPILSVDVEEQVIASVLRKLGPEGDVSHEEALGGQAIREAAAEYGALIGDWEEFRERDPAAAEDALSRARDVLGSLQAVRENYHMIDDDFQLSVLVGRYLARSDVPADRKRSFLVGAVEGEVSRLDALVRNLALVAELASPYATDPVPVNLVGFQRRDDRGWLPGSWRDSRVGYGGGRYAMDVNVVWVPKALEAVAGIVAEMDALGLSTGQSIESLERDASSLAAWVGEPALLRSALETWRGARRHFEVELAPNEIRRHVDELLASMEGPEREYWKTRFEESGADARPLSFLAVALDTLGRPVAVASTDPATDLFLGDYTAGVLDGSTEPTVVIGMLDAIVRPYPVGLFVEGLGPLVVNDAYTTAEVRRAFREDPYHGPRVVWGREVNLLLLALALQIDAAYDASGQLRDDRESVRTYAEALRSTLEATAEAVEASGLRHNELWSYRIEDGTLHPTRYGTSSDIQLWNVTDLAVRFLVDGLPPS